MTSGPLASIARGALLSSVICIAALLSTASAAIRALEPRRHGIILGEGCDRVPELADVR